MRYRVRIDFNYWNSTRTEISDSGVEIFYVKDILELPRELENYLLDLNLGIVTIKKIEVYLVIDKN